MNDESIFAHAVRILFLIGLVASALALFVEPLPNVHLVIAVWLVIGGLGIVTGIVAWKTATRGIVMLTIVLVVSTSAILLQPYNPQWLENAVFWIRVFVAHVGLAAGILGVLLPRAEVA